VPGGVGQRGQPSGQGPGQRGRPGPPRLDRGVPQWGWHLGDDDLGQAGVAEQAGQPLGVVEVEGQGADVAEPGRGGPGGRDRGHLGGDVGQHHLAGRADQPRGRDPDAAGAAGQLEHALAGSRGRELEQLGRDGLATGVGVVGVLGPCRGHRRPHAVQLGAQLAGFAGGRDPPGDPGGGRAAVRAAGLRPGLDVARATDILWTLNHPDVWLLLVGERGWTPEQWERWFADTACAQLLGHPPPGA
jgi:hypothetical protein